jgi:hypothetical protein
MIVRKYLKGEPQPPESEQCPLGTRPHQARGPHEISHCGAVKHRGVKDGEPDLRPPG